MPMLGTAAVAMWWDIAATDRAEFEDWHAHEHFPERLGIPGFLRGSRWASADGGDGFFVLYELEAYGTLTSPGYVARLNAPTPWSTAMMPKHRGMVRSQCRLLHSRGGGISGWMLTLRLSPAPGRADALQAHLQHQLDALPQQPGFTAGHLLQTQTPAAAVTAEQRIRGGADAVADWIVLVGGYDPQALRGLAGGDLADGALRTAGARPTPTAGLYRLSYTMTPNDLQTAAVRAPAMDAPTKKPKQ